jgi:hypothetical protein
MSPERRLLESLFADAACAWSLGTYGAIAEFAYDRDEAATRHDADRAVGLRTARGAIRIEFAANPRLVAWETPSLTAGRWSHGVACCLVDGEARGPGRTALTELGRDAGAIGAEDRDAILFDMGVGAPHVDFCVRTRDATLIELLRRHAGESVFASGSPVGAAIQSAQPHRVAVSRLGRIEVYQPIAAPDGRTPSGPHTHLLPALLVTGRTHAETMPVPAGHFSCLEAYPASPILDIEGEPIAFDAMRHVAFEVVLKDHGPGEYVAEKARLREAFSNGVEPRRYPPPRSALSRAAVRVALRQLASAGAEERRLAPWLAAFDRPDDPAPAGH